MYRIIIVLLILSVIGIACKSSYQHVADAEVEYIRTTEDINTSDDEIKNIIEPYKVEMDAKMNQVLGILPEDLKKDRLNSNMGNWFCDALHYTAQKHFDGHIDFAIQNNGGFRLPFLGKGPITTRNIYELMPFDNKLVILELNSDIMLQLADHFAEDGGWPISKGLSFRIDDDKAADIMISGKAFNTLASYYVAMPDYVANGGGGCGFLKDIPQTDTGLYIRDAIIEYLNDMASQNQELIVDSAKRIK